MSGNLRQRLARIRDARVDTYPVVARPLPEPACVGGTVSRPLDDSWIAVAEGVRKREVEEFLPAKYAGQHMAPRVFSKAQEPGFVRARSLAFFDLETTGLSGGSGTVAFLAAVGRYVDDSSFVVKQYFLEDYPYETDFLQCLENEFSDVELVVTYNGSSFDMPLYTTRRSLNRLPPARSIGHLDALHAARRLWRRPFGDCSLQNLEATVLGARRADDIPGSEIPSVWFEFLRHGDCGRLQRVFEHNAKDIVSLATLFFTIGLGAYDGIFPAAFDPVGLAELQSRVDAGKAETTLRAAMDGGDERAVRPLMRLLRGQSREAERVALVPRLPDDAAGLFSKSVYAERIEGDIRLAVEYARRAMEAARPDSGILDRARRREERLGRRIIGDSTVA